MAVEFNLLTAKQKKVYAAIESFIHEKGIPPTVREIGEMVGEKTPGAVQGILNRLEQKGVIKREVGMARSIQLISDSTLYAQSVFVPELKKITARNINDLFNVYNIKKYHPFSSGMLSTNDECFIIECPDNSLYDSGIKYEDLLVISRNFDLNDGDIILALIEGHVLLRSYFNDPSTEGSMILKANSNLLGKENFSEQEVLVIGKLLYKITRF